MSVTKWAGPKRKDWTVEEYYQLADMGAFRNQRVELIEGEIIQMAPMRTPHAASLELTKFALDAIFGPGHWVRMQLPLNLGRRSEPQPDIAVVPGNPRDYLAHPNTALLLVEISQATLSYDRRRKGSLYARAGIADYWIVNLNRRRLEVYRQPVPDPSRRYGHGYSVVQTYTASESATPLAAPHAKVCVADLLP